VSEIIEAYQVPSESLDVRFLVFEGESIECSGLIGIDGLGRKQGDETNSEKSRTPIVVRCRQNMFIVSSFFNTYMASK
jgi:hypothetical protein